MINTPKQPLIDKIQLELGVHEPWPSNVKLFQPYEVEQILLHDNANCLAVQAFLKMCDLDFQVECRANAVYMSPSGKVPFIKCGAFVVSELEGIVQFVDNKGISLSSDLEDDDRSRMRAYMSLIHSVLENAELYLCWCDKETYNEVTRRRYGSVYPFPLNHFQTWAKRSEIVSHLKIMKWQQKSLDEVFQEVDKCCQALAELLGDKEYFFGTRTELDALIFGHVYAILSTPLPGGNPLAFLINGYDSLVDHCRRIDESFMSHRSKLSTENYNITETERAADMNGASKTVFEHLPYENLGSGDHPLGNLIEEEEEDEAL